MGLKEFMKKLTFKKLLAGEFDKSKSLDGQLRNMMEHFGWVTQPLGPDELVKMRPVVLEGYFYEGSSEWNKDIRQALKNLGRF